MIGDTTHVWSNRYDDIPWQCRQQFPWGFGTYLTN